MSPWFPLPRDTDLPHLIAHYTLIVMQRGFSLGGSDEISRSGAADRSRNNRLKINVFFQLDKAVVS
jgi:hypothetical protein